MSTPHTPSYFGDFFRAVGSIWNGIRLTWRHMRNGTRRRSALAPTQPGYFGPQTGAVTIQYPIQQTPLPQVGRYRLHLETEDCIGCDQCARICPVDCIDIVKIKAVDDLGQTSDGTKKKFHLPVFDIDMAKCCYCGLCTVVCPTECLTMTPVYDFAERDRDNFVYHFGNQTPDEARQVVARLQALEAEKAAAKAAASKKQETGNKKQETVSEVA